MNYLTLLDHNFNNYLITTRTETLNKIMLAITNIGEAKVIILLILLTAIVLWKLKKQRYIIPLCISCGGDFLTSAAGKLWFHRPRPLQAVYVEKLYSFPSSHSAITVVFFGFLTFIIWQNFNKAWLKYTALSIAILLCALIGFTRLYLGVHYLSDVVGGFLIGMLWLAIGMWIAKKINKKNRRKNGLN